MRFLDILLTFFAIITPYVVQAANTISVPTAGDNVMAGDDLKIKWTPSTKGKITLTLRFGAANSLSQGTEIASGIDNSGSFSWPVPKEFGSGFYTVEITDESSGETNYSPLFSVSGGLGLQGTTLSTPGVTATSTGKTGGFKTAASSSSASTSSSAALAPRVAVFREAGAHLAAVLGAGAVMAMV